MEQDAIGWMLFELSKFGLLPNGIPNDIHIKAKEIQKENIVNAIRLGAGSLGEWTPDLERAILNELNYKSE